MFYICLIMNHKEDILNNLAGAIFIVFFFLLLSSFSQNPRNSCNDRGQNALISELPSGSFRAVITEAFQFKSLGKSIVSRIINKNHSLFSEKLKISDDTRKISQTIIFLKKSVAFQNPQTFCRYYYHYFSKSSNELPVLS